MKEIKNVPNSFFYYMDICKVTTHLSLTFWQNHIHKLILSPELHRDRNWWCPHEYTSNPTDTTAALHNHTQTNFAFHWIHNHNASQIPPATFSPLHTKFPTIKTSRTRILFYFLMHAVQSLASLIHRHALVWEEPTYGLLNLV